MLSNRRNNDYREDTTPRQYHRFGIGRSKDPDRVAGGYKAALSNPNTTSEGRHHAKQELKAMGRESEAHISLMTRVKMALGIRSMPRTERKRESRSRRGFSMPGSRSARTGTTNTRSRGIL